MPTLLARLQTWKSQFRCRESGCSDGCVAVSVSKLYKGFTENIGACARSRYQALSSFREGLGTRLWWSIDWRVEASLPSSLNGAIFQYNWRAGASQPSRSNGVIFLYYIYIIYIMDCHIP